MRRKHVHMAILLAIALISWIYWKPNTEFKENPFIWDFINTVTLQPFPPPCENNNPFLVIIVTSAVSNVDIRSAHRIMLPAQKLRQINATRVFLVAQIPDNARDITQSVINDESIIYGDILQGTFTENYRNLTYKHLMGLKWASTVCRGAPFILKVDDDTVYNLEITIDFLKSVYTSNTPVHLMGNIIKFKPLRKENYKFYVTWDEYPREDYPPFLAGWYYITTPQVAAALCAEAIYHPYFWIEDVFVTGLLTEALGFELTELPDVFSLVNYMNCEYSQFLKQFDCWLENNNSSELSSTSILIL